MISPEGEHLGTIEVPENVGNHTWGGPDWHTLFIPSSTSVYTITDEGRPAARAVHAIGGCDVRTDTRRRALARSRPRCALIIQDMQNDVIIEGGAFAESGSPGHAKEQNVVANVADLAAACRAKGIPVIHVWYIVEPGAPGLKLNAPLFNGVKDTGALVRGTWGAAPADGLEPQDGDYVVEKMRMSGWQGTQAREPARRPRPRHGDRHGRVDEHVDRAHRPARAPTRASRWSCPRTAARR